MDTVTYVATIIGTLVQGIGMLVFGVGVGWLATYAFKHTSNLWPLAAIVFFSLVGAATLFVHWGTPGTVGAFALGAGGGTLFFGLRGAGEPPKQSKG